jgi:hypothetical protein
MRHNYLLCWYQQYFPYDLSVTTSKPSSKYLRVFTLNPASLFRLKCTNKGKILVDNSPLLRSHIKECLEIRKLFNIFCSINNRLATNINSASVELFVSLFVFKKSPLILFPANCVYESQYKILCSIAYTITHLAYFCFPLLYL